MQSISCVKWPLGAHFTLEVEGPWPMKDNYVIGQKAKTAQVHFTLDPSNQKQYERMKKYMAFYMAISE